VLSFSFDTPFLRCASKISPFRPFSFVLLSSTAMRKCLNKYFYPTPDLTFDFRLLDFFTRAISCRSFSFPFPMFFLLFPEEWILLYYPLCLIFVISNACCVVLPLFFFFFLTLSVCNLWPPLPFPLDVSLNAFLFFLPHCAEQD